MVEQVSTSRFGSPGGKWVEARGSIDKDGRLSGMVEFVLGSNISWDRGLLLPEEVERFAQQLLDVAKAARGDS